MKRRCTQSEFLVERYRIPLPLMQRVDIIIPLQKEIISIITGTIFKRAKRELSDAFT